ncbi:MAG: hypothetical protein KJ904_12500 [Alphaproteobacteria bacterium]|nr:hypothetical protein [Alphaproteobacteria bacterium]MBU0799182.1 hypothetical protein [Alphaproteobacteria bacterium]MBU0887973.1 hypothetical protein [Alphaproteobacteria bacterium]MBU1814804.1 hypothetical protein [Alphaproteobacteria bacterium]
MAIDGLSNGLSGALAATNRFAVSANNTANVLSQGIDPQDQEAARNDPTGQTEVPGFQPLQAVDQNLADGGVRSTTRPIEPSSIPFLQGAGEEIGFQPNVDLAGEAVQQITSQRQFEANLRTVQTGLQLSRSLLDINS